MIPYEDRFTLVGTTDVRSRGRRRAISPRAKRKSTTCAARPNRYLAARRLRRTCVWRYAGVRPLYDDGSSDPSAITRDYTLRVDDAEGAAPVLSVFGGKITTYRRLAEHALEKLAPYFPGDEAGVDRASAAAGQRLRRPRSGERASCFQRYPAGGAQRAAGRLPPPWRARAPRCSATARLGEYYGAGLTEREVALSHARRNGRAPPRTCCGAGPSAACA